jgi:hypothetical protein
MGSSNKIWQDAIENGVERANLPSRTDHRDCLLYSGEFRKLPSFSNHKTNLRDHCANHEPQKLLFPLLEF